MATMREVTELGNRIEELTELSIVLAKAIDNCDDYKSMAQLARQYRETLKELGLLNNEVKENDEIGNILSNRLADGKSGAVRKSSSTV